MYLDITVILFKWYNNFPICALTTCRLSMCADFFTCEICFDIHICSQLFLLIKQCIAGRRFTNPIYYLIRNIQSLICSTTNNHQRGIITRYSRRSFVLQLFSDISLWCECNFRHFAREILLRRSETNGSALTKESIRHTRKIITRGDQTRQVLDYISLRWHAELIYDIFCDDSDTRLTFDELRNHKEQGAVISNPR